MYRLMKAATKVVLHILATDLNISCLFPESHPLDYFFQHGVKQAGTDDTLR